MRTHRFLSGLLGLALVGLTPLTLTAPAATAGEGVVAAPSTAVPVAERAKPSRELNDRSVRRGGSWYIVGRITPEGGRHVVEFKRKFGAKAGWRVWKRVKADGKGRYSVRVDFPRGTRATWYYKGIVYGGAKYRTSRTDKIYTACRRASC
jgi:hypothetical protein